MRETVEKLVFAGLKPDAPAPPKHSKIESLIHSAEEFATRGLKPEEAALPGPMRPRRKLLIAAGALAAAAGVTLLIVVLQRPADKQEAAGVAAPAPLVPPGLTIEKNKELAVEEIDFRWDKEPKEIVGTLRNLTGKRFAVCEVSFDVSTKDGWQLGGVATQVRDIAPHGTAQFRIPVPQKDAAFAMVRELRAE